VSKIRISIQRLWLQRPLITGVSPLICAGILGGLVVSSRLEHVAQARAFLLLLGLPLSILAVAIWICRSIDCRPSFDRSYARHQRHYGTLAEVGDFVEFTALIFGLLFGVTISYFAFGQSPQYLAIFALILDQLIATVALRHLRHGADSRGRSRVAE
jgi:hypothetical protein